MLYVDRWFIIVFTRSATGLCSEPIESSSPH